MTRILRVAPGRVLLPLVLVLAVARTPDARGEDAALASGIITADFVLTPVRPEGVDQVGRFYLSPGRGWWRIDFTSPVVQTMVATDTLTAILYPRDEQAFLIHAARLDPPSAIFFFMTAMATNEELAQSGLRITDFDVAGDTTITTWSVPLPDGSGVGATMVMRRVGPGIARLDFSGRDGARRRFTVESADTVAGERVPRRVRLEEWGRGGHVETRIAYGEVGTAAGDPLAVYSTAVPPGYRVTERSW